MPNKIKFIFIDDVKPLVRAIKDMVVRGAPVIGIATAYGVVLAARKAYQTDSNRWHELISSDLEVLSTARLTAVNPGWAITRMSRLFNSITGNPEEILLHEAQRIHEEDIQANKKMGMFGAELMQEVGQVITHCNTGSLATGGYGTALGVIRTAYLQGLVDRVYVCETRPWLQGSKLTAWELQQDGISVTLIVDSTASYLMQNRQVKWVIVGADRIAGNGDVANKIGTYAHAIAARYHKKKFMVVAPTTSIDLNIPAGVHISIEDRSPGEITEISGHSIAPESIDVWNPSFDITPVSLIDFIVTEKGVIHQPDGTKIAAILG